MKKLTQTLTSIAVLVAMFIASGCVSKTAKATLEEYNQVYTRIETLEQMVATSDFSAMTPTLLREIHSIGSELYYNFNPMDLKAEQITACELLKARVDTLREKIVNGCNEALKSVFVDAYNFSDTLIESAQTYPVYLQKGEKLHISVNGNGNFTVKIGNANSRSIIKSITGKKSVTESLDIANTAIYLVEVIPMGAQYIDLAVQYQVADATRLTPPTQIYSEEVECNKGDFGAKGIPGISMRRCFEEPRKFTLRGQLKAAFSGNAKALVAVQIPEGATDILYSMRIATSESSRSSDGEFHDNLSRSYKRVKFLGMPIYEKSTSNGLLNTLLDDNRPLRDEDAYCNMYVFRNQSMAKQFQDGTKSASQLSYDVNYSTIGTQSCNGRIPVKGLRTIYLAFENERMRYTNYLWVEVEAVVPHTVYYTTKYSIK